MRRWECMVCGFIYDEAEGWPEDGIAPGTRWEDVPDDWQCPECGVSKSDFALLSRIVVSGQGSYSNNRLPVTMAVMSRENFFTG